MAVYYNEIDPFCCDWLRQLINRGMLPDGEIDNRSIEDVKPGDLKGFTQCHFFAGIGGWPYTLRLADWPDDRPVWTGSCPCQPFSTAGKRAGTSDERHLWPAFDWLIGQCHPVMVFGEQVESKDALAWFDLVRTDLEGKGYAIGVVDTCAAGFGAPHIRQRLYWMAQSQSHGRRGRDNGNSSRVRGEIQTSGRSSTGELADTEQPGLQGQPQPDRSSQGRQEQAGCPVHAGNETCRMGITEEIRRQQEQTGRYGPPEKCRQTGSECGTCVSGEITGRVEYPHSEWEQRDAGKHTGKGGSEESALHMGCAVTDSVGRTMPTNGFWANPDWLWCRDKKWRPIKSGAAPLVDGLSCGMGSRRDSRAISQRLKGYGNAIVIPQAVEFIKTVMEVLE